MAGDASGAQALLDRMLKKPMFAVLRTPRNLERMGELLEAHLRWMIAAEQRGDIFASGPFVPDSGPPGTAGGMTLVRAESRDAVDRLLADDPFVKQGVYSIEIRKWLLMEGEITVSVRLSDRSYTLS